jgi:hypothetical protein
MAWSESVDHRFPESITAQSAEPFTQTWRSQRSLSKRLAVDRPAAPPDPSTEGMSAFSFTLNRQKLSQGRRREGRYLPRTNLSGRDPAELWQLYIQLVDIEAAFKNLKDDLVLRPFFINSSIGSRRTSLSLSWPCQHVTLRARLRSLAPGLTPPAVLDRFAAIQMLDVHLPTTDGRTLILSRYTPSTRRQLARKAFESQLEHRFYSTDLLLRCGSRALFQPRYPLQLRKTGLPRKEDGTKRFAKETRKHRYFHVTGVANSVATLQKITVSPGVVIAEGCAKAATIAKHSKVAAIDRFRKVHFSNHFGKADQYSPHIIGTAGNERVMGLSLIFRRGTEYFLFRVFTPFSPLSAR